MPPSPQAVTDGSKTWSPSHLFSSVVEGNDETTSTAAPAPAPGVWDKIHAHLQANEFRAAIASAFELPAGDNFTYHATASVNLAQAEAAIRAGRVNGLHGWYVERVSPPPAPPSAPATGGSDGVGENNDDDENNDSDKNSNDPSEPRTIPGQPSLRISGYPPPADIQAYISLFDPTRSAANSLKSLAANAKKGSLRATVAEYLLSKRYLDASISVPKFKPSPVVVAVAVAAQQDGSNQQPSSSRTSSKTTTRHENPALDFWAYSCTALEYAGPNANTALVKMSHHILPVYMHHFGCVCPSWEALQVIAKLASSISTSTSTSTTSTGTNTGTGPTHSANSKNRSRRTPTVLDMGSGNGYWTLMLRRLGPDLDVVAVDSGQSRWRTVWIPDTHVADGVQYLRKRGGCPSSLLLLVYPIVGSGGSGTGEFTRRVLDAYTGDVVCVAGTQNGNGYTGFKDVMVDEYMARERPGWEKVAQVALPSFAGKDDALFAFRRRKKTVDGGGGQS
ncbi:hypothetical protein Z517_04740 [Fonsecaea pedrosoi CBS 271.37]|uniref:Uncharacterized protein n=1 Tax=Fonsecaea pedrosoi CBS 271.37 TaxID=1442368 RepID=A0A0D2HAW9_9EURO|nr:uncharacterized protein Z517_04740 [Fonsecaea pedrosoi CBS 271.37]KIW81714.1 hypothetical protein Z517_04740 [Fonsecaea pedrosoi CBS 271.37]